MALRGHFKPEISLIPVVNSRFLGDFCSQRWKTLWISFFRLTWVFSALWYAHLPETSGVTRESKSPKGRRFARVRRVTGTGRGSRWHHRKPRTGKAARCRKCLGGRYRGTGGRKPAEAPEPNGTAPRSRPVSTGRLLGASCFSHGSRKLPIWIRGLLLFSGASLLVRQPSLV